MQIKYKKFDNNRNEKVKKLKLLKERKRSNS
jgi:hypothetical protein